MLKNSKSGQIIHISVECLLFEEHKFISKSTKTTNFLNDLFPKEIIGILGVAPCSSCFVIINESRAVQSSSFMNEISTPLSFNICTLVISHFSSAIFWLRKKSCLYCRNKFTESIKKKGIYFSWTC